MMSDASKAKGCTEFASLPFTVLFELYVHISIYSTITYYYYQSEKIRTVPLQELPTSQ